MDGRRRVGWGKEKFTQYSDLLNGHSLCCNKCCNKNTKQILVRKIKKLLIGSHLTMMRVVSCRCPLHLWKVEVTSMTGLGTGLRRRCSKIIIQHLRIPTLEFLFPMGSRVSFQIADRSQCQRIAANSVL